MRNVENKTAYQQVEGFLYSYVLTQTKYELLLSDIEFLKNEKDSVTTPASLSNAPGRGSSSNSPVEATALEYIDNIKDKEIQASRLQRMLNAYDIAMARVLTDEEGHIIWLRYIEGIQWVGVAEKVSMCEICLG